MNKNKNIYKITHFYGSDESSIFIKSEKEIAELIEVLACIDLKFEEIVDDSACMSEDAVGLILEGFYEIELIKDLPKRYLEVITKETFLHSTRTVSNRIVTIIEESGYGAPIIQIDRFWARESCCGETSVKLMKKHLPVSNEFNEIIKRSKIG
ncbi:hypothetical protein FITA111629_15325 [Filibacter tadaridae]|uniref:Uncharacterized protein n=1 Tax=Filibacter tadaridae TaxID=2483811 RepID=A0A3P5WDT4_9BACL|nr:hypothetical protein [Filibacter tadaridae]VDC17996.1 hypothetical protein FILTAD_00015 [Filibacter tadaridae]